MEDVVVIGGGLAGLTTAFRLLAAGKRVQCLEASAAAGGCVRTDKTAGYRCERGAQNFLEAAGGPVHRLAADLGIAGRIEAARETANYLVWDDRLLRLPRHLPRVLSFRGLARALLETGVPRSNGNQDECQEESVAAWARRRFGEEVGLRLIDPMISGIYAGDPERLSARAAFPAGVELERKHRSVIVGACRSRFAQRRVAGFRDGMGALPETLAKKLGPALRVGARVMRITSEGNRYRIAVRNASSGTVSDCLVAKHVIVATPAPRAAEVVGPLDPALALLLEQIPYAGVVSVWLAYTSSDFGAAPPTGYGVMRPHCQGARVLGCIFCSSLFDGAAPTDRILIRLMLGGRRDPEAVALGNAELIELARQELSAMLGIRPHAKPCFVHVVRQDPGLPQYELGHLDRLAAIEGRCRRLPGLHLAGSAYHGIPVGKVIAQADRVAEQLLRSDP